MSETQTKKAKKREKVLVDVGVEADLSGMIFRGYCKTAEDEAKELERAVKDFHDFLRDHRSQDLVTLTVNKVYKDLCSACGNEWEIDVIEGKTFCAYCGVEIEDNPELLPEKKLKKN